MKRKDYVNILENLAENMTDGVHVVNRDGISIIYNQAMADLEKTNREDILGRPFREGFEHIPLDESTLHRALVTGTPTINIRQTYLNKYGVEITAVNTTVPVKEGDEVIAAIEISKDITAIKNMSQTIIDLNEVAKEEKAQDGIRRYGFDDLVGQNEEFLQVIALAKKAATSNASVFIYGETGTGKELFSQSIHYASSRKNRPFLAQNCAAIPESLLEGILFGTEKGGFTGAVDRPGLFEQADGGTLLLDEISAMPYELQSKLLRVLQEDYVRRVGGTKDIPIDVRIIATVNEPPAELIESGRLRKDLYYRLGIVNVNIPPLRERKDDIPLLVEGFLKKHNKRFNKHVAMITDGAMKELADYDFPGNVRELENVIMGAISVVDKEHVLTEKHLQPFKGNNMRPAVKGGFVIGETSIDIYLEDQEKMILADAMRKYKGNVSKAAEALGIKRQTLQHKLKKYCMQKT